MAGECEINVRQGAHHDAPGEWIWLWTVTKPDGGIKDGWAYSEDEATEEAEAFVEQYEEGVEDDD